MLLCRYFYNNRISAPFLGYEIVFHKRLLNSVGVCALFINLVYSDYYSYSRRFCMVYCLYCLRHYTIVSRNHKYSNIRYLCTSCTHCRERFMTRRIEERYVTVIQTHTVCTYMLCYTACLGRGYICVSYCVKERCLTVVNVTHNDNYRRTGDEILCLILLLGIHKEHILFCYNNFLLYFYAEIIADKRRRIEIYRLIHRSHNTEHKQLFYNLRTGFAYLLRKFAYGYCFGDFHLCYYLFRNYLLRLLFLLFFLLNIFLVEVILSLFVSVSAVFLYINIVRNHIFYSFT